MEREKKVRKVRKTIKKEKTFIFSIEISEEMSSELEKQALERGIKSRGAYIRFLCKEGLESFKKNKK